MTRSPIDDRICDARMQQRREKIKAQSIEDKEVSINKLISESIVCEKVRQWWGPMLRGEKQERDRDREIERRERRV